MKSGAGKSKGAAFEREVCKRLSLWLSNGLRDDLLWRSAMSGGRATLQFARGKVNLTQSGDVSAVGEGAFAFCEKNYVEVKFYKDLQIDRSFLCGTGGLLNFWKTTVIEAAKYNKAPMLVAKQNLFPSIVMIVNHNHIFSDEPMIVLNHLHAHVYLFDHVTRVVAPLRRRAG